MKNRQIKSVVDGMLCAECGTCAGVCPRGAIRMTESRGGQCLPVIDESVCTDCGLCDRVCPQINVSESLAGWLADPCVGPVRDAFLCQAADPQARAAGQTAGCVRSLLAWLIESKTVDAAVCVVDEPASPLRPRAVLTRDPAVALASSRSKYCPVPVNSLLSELRKFDGRVAWLGLGCHLQGLELCLQAEPNLRKKVAIRLGLFCAGIMSYRACDFLVRRAALSAGHIRRLDYKDKSLGGWPGDVAVESSDGRVVRVSKSDRLRIRDWFTPLHCHLCVDKLNVLSDVCFGDPWSVKAGKSVPAAVLTRTDAGGEAIRLAGQAGRLEVVACTAEQKEMMLAGQRVDRRVRQAQVCASELLRTARPVPVFLRTGPLAASPGNGGPAARRAIRAGRRIHNGAAILDWLPGWLPGLTARARRLLTAPKRVFGKLARRLGIGRAGKDSESHPNID